jgi:hypothetical protein
VSAPASLLPPPAINAAVTSTASERQPELIPSDLRHQKPPRDLPIKALDLLHHRPFLFPLKVPQGCAIGRRSPQHLALFFVDSDEPPAFLAFSLVFSP